MPELGQMAEPPHVLWQGFACTYWGACRQRLNESTRAKSGYGRMDCIVLAQVPCTSWSLLTAVHRGPSSHSGAINVKVDTLSIASLPPLPPSSPSAYECGKHNPKLDRRVRQAGEPGRANCVGGKRLEEDEASTLLPPCLATTGDKQVRRAHINEVAGAIHIGLSCNPETPM
ncbi:hypothetical protein BX600DRAFT_241186 [Xylariales sp. PMI_506]|nr:hypothetical protein BX600DRAFT_241186 [Xylariales sp. PMI_506]